MHKKPKKTNQQQKKEYISLDYHCFQCCVVI